MARFPECQDLSDGRDVRPLFHVLLSLIDPAVQRLHDCDLGAILCQSEIRSFCAESDPLAVHLNAIPPGRTTVFAALEEAVGSPANEDERRFALLSGGFCSQFCSHKSLPDVAGLCRFMQ